MARGILAVALVFALAPAARADGPKAPTPTAAAASESPALRFVRSLAASLPEGDIVKEKGDPRLLGSRELAATRHASFPKKPSIGAALVDAASVAIAEKFDPDMPLGLVLAFRFDDPRAAREACDELDRASIPDYTDVFAAGPLVVIVSTTKPVTGDPQARLSRQARAVLTAVTENKK